MLITRSPTLRQQRDLMRKLNVILVQHIKKWSINIINAFFTYQKAVRLIAWFIEWLTERSNWLRPENKNGHHWIIDQMDEYNLEGLWSDY